LAEGAVLLLPAVATTAGIANHTNAPATTMPSLFIPRSLPSFFSERIIGPECSPLARAGMDDEFWYPHHPL
jgi:hypothetical protein